MLPFGQLWYTQVSDAVDYAKFYSRSYDAVIGVHDDAGDVIEIYALVNPGDALAGSLENVESDPEVVALREKLSVSNRP